VFEDRLLRIFGAYDLRESKWQKGEENSAMKILLICTTPKIF
jgi:hypothetical protein